MEITKEYLEAYKSKKEEIKELRYKLDHLGDGDSLIGNDVINDYQKGYPRPQSVVGYDQDKERRLRSLYTAKIARLQAECAETETWVEAIPDSLMRRIFRMYYIDGLRQNKVSSAVHLSQASVSERISAYFRKSDKTDKKV